MTVFAYLERHCWYSWHVAVIIQHLVLSFAQKFTFRLHKTGSSHLRQAPWQNKSPWLLYPLLVVSLLKRWSQGQTPVALVMYLPWTALVLSCVCAKMAFRQFILSSCSSPYCSHTLTACTSYLQIQVAIKCLSKDQMQNNPMEFLKEAVIMHTIDHEHIVRLYGVVLDTVSLMLVSGMLADVLVLWH